MPRGVAENRLEASLTAISSCVVLKVPTNSRDCTPNRFANISSFSGGRGERDSN